jgi:tetratricopeptide (TPR) repeat protein
LFLAHALMESGNQADALSELRRAAIELDQHGQVYAEFRIYLGQALVHAGAIPDAELQLQKARLSANAKTHMGVTYISRLEAELLLAGSKAEAAVAGIDTGPEIKSTDPVAVELRARAFAAAGQVDRAIENYKKLIDSKKVILGWEAQLTYPQAHLALARLYMKRGQNDEAMQVLEKFQRLWSKADPDAVLMREAHAMEASLRKPLPVAGQ